MSTAQQRERSDTHKMTRGLCEHMSQSPSAACTRKNDSWKRESDVLPGGLWNTALATKNGPEASEVLRLQRK